MRARTIPLAILALLMAVAVAGTPGCSSDSPSEPSNPPPGGGGGGGGTTFNITVTANPAVLAAGGDQGSTIRVQVRRADNGAPPPNGTTVVVNASGGSLDTLGGGSSVVLTLTGGNASVLFFPPADPGTAVIQAQLQNSVGQVQVQIAQPDTLFISFVDPGVGEPGGGEEVTVRGNAFEGPVRVTFGTGNAQVLSVSPSSIRVITPPSPNPGNQQAVVNVAVTINVNEEDQATDTLAGGFTYSPGGSTEVPAVLSVTPGSGPNEGGTHVIIVGSGFVAPMQVLFGTGNNAGTFEGIEAQIQSVTSTRLEVLSPAALGFGQDLQNQTVAILVRNLTSGLAAVQPSAFRYGTQVLITALSTGRGDYRGGDLVTIFGQGFDAPVAVTFGSLIQTPLSVTGTEIVVRTSAARVENCTVDSEDEGTVTVTNIETGDSADGPAWIYLIPQPLITGVNPTSGPEGGNTLVTVSGSGFEPPTRVLFGGSAGSIQSQASTSISVRTPAFTGQFPVQACQDGEGNTGERFLPFSVNVTVINLATGCQDTLPNAFAYLPSDPSCRVEAPPPP